MIILFLFRKLLESLLVSSGWLKRGSGQKVRISVLGSIHTQSVI
jgi:hypothetical protein